nr:hypothetical transcript [Hymenolepis microstoma]
MTSKVYLYSSNADRPLNFCSTAKPVDLLSEDANKLSKVIMKEFIFFESGSASLEELGHYKLENFNKTAEINQGTLSDIDQGEILKTYP